MQSKPKSRQCAVIVLLIYRVSVISDYDCILVMLLGSSRDKRLEVTSFSVLTTSGTVSGMQSSTRPG